MTEAGTSVTKSAENQLEMDSSKVLEVVDMMPIDQLEEWDKDKDV